MIVAGRRRYVTTHCESCSRMTSLRLLRSFFDSSTTTNLSRVPSQSALQARLRQLELEHVRDRRHGRGSSEELLETPSPPLGQSDSKYLDESADPEASVYVTPRKVRFARPEETRTPQARTVWVKAPWGPCEEQCGWRQPNAHIPVASCTTTTNPSFTDAYTAIPQSPARRKLRWIVGSSANLCSLGQVRHNLGPLAPLIKDPQRFSCCLMTEWPPRSSRPAARLESQVVPIDRSDRCRSSENSKTRLAQHKTSSGSTHGWSSTGGKT